MGKMQGIVYTPEWIVNLILDSIGYKPDLEHCRIIDPSCGTGNFLSSILERLLTHLEKRNYSKNEIEEIVADQIYGIDTDRSALEICKKNLNNILLNHHLDGAVELHLYNRNALDTSQNKKLFKKFKFVVGNPPYVRVQNMNPDLRKSIQENYSFCSSGSSDIYIAFFQMGLELLGKEGILAFITPNTFLYSKSAKAFRSYLHQNKLIRTLINFNERQLFERITTYSAITILSKDPSREYFSYCDYKDGLKTVEDIPYKSLRSDKWVLGSLEVLNKIDQIENRGKKLGEIAKIHAGIATLADDLYITNLIEFSQDTVIVRLRNGDKVELERRILKPIVKVSTLKYPNQDQNLLIIFPYKSLNGKFVPYEEDEMKSLFPLTYDYFKSIKRKLVARDRGNNIIPWYAFGRNQGLNTSFGKKILVSPVSKSPRFILWEKPEYTFYSGYCIKYDGNLASLIKQLNSEDMRFYVEKISRIYKGGYRSYAKSFIENYGVDISNL
jgi:methylase of polypeptide subunit release factors